MELFIAINNETNEVKMFNNREDLKEFAIKKQYSYSYYVLGDVEEIPDIDLFYYEVGRGDF